MAVISTGIVRPPQVTNTEHKIANVYSLDESSEKLLETYSIEIKAFDSRMTDLLARLISGVLYSNMYMVQNAEENLLREKGLWVDKEYPQQTAERDITREPAAPPTPPSAVGNG